MQRTIFRRLVAAGIVAGTALTAQAQIQATDSPKWPIVELSAESAQAVANDLAQTTVFIELVDPNPADLAKRVNQKTAEALAMAKRFPSVRTKTRGLQTYPIYSKSGTRIENWRIRSEIQLESSDIAALSELTGQLQNVTAVAQLSLMPSTDTRQKAIDAATVEAIKAFRARAELIAQTLGKPWRIRTLQLGTMPDIQPMFRASMAKSAMVEAAPAPIEAGESTVRITASGSIELLDGAK